MAKRVVVWTETAIKQRREILKYWTLRNKSSAYAEKLIKLIAKRTKLLQKNPEAFRVANFPETRVSSLGHFSLFYQVTETQIIVTAFWDNRQDPKELLALIQKQKE